MVNNTTIRRLAILHKIEKYLTDAESDKATAYGHLAGNGATAALEAKWVTQKPFRMAEGSLSSFAAIKLIYVEINGYPLENKEDNRCFYGKCLLYLRYEKNNQSFAI